MRISGIVGLSVVALVGLGSLGANCHPAPAASAAALQCTECVGGDVVMNYSSPAPLPFYPGFCGKLLADCGAECGSDLVVVINSIAGSQNPKVQATPAYAEAKARRAAMLGPRP